MTILNEFKSLQLIISIFDWKTKNYQHHIGCSYDYISICVDGQYSKPYQPYFDEDAIEKFYG